MKFCRYLLLGIKHYFFLLLLPATNDLGMNSLLSHHLVMDTKLNHCQEMGILYLNLTFITLQKSSFFNSIVLRTKFYCLNFFFLSVYKCLFIRTALPKKRCFFLNYNMRIVFMFFCCQIHLFRNSILMIVYNNNLFLPIHAIFWNTGGWTIELYMIRVNEL